MSQGIALAFFEKRFFFISQGKVFRISEKV